MRVKKGNISRTWLINQDILRQAVHFAYRPRVGGPSHSYQGHRYEYAEHSPLFNRLSGLLRQTNDRRPGIIVDDIKTIRLLWDWWAGLHENVVVELKSSEEYHRLADHYMKKTRIYA